MNENEENVETDLEKFYKESVPVGTLEIHYSSAIKHLKLNKAKAGKKDYISTQDYYLNYYIHTVFCYLMKSKSSNE